MNVKSIINCTIKIHLFPEEARSFFIKKSGFDVLRISYCSNQKVIIKGSTIFMIHRSHRFLSILLSFAIFLTAFTGISFQTVQASP